MNHQLERLVFERIFECVNNFSIILVKPIYESSVGDVLHVNGKIYAKNSAQSASISTSSIHVYVNNKRIPDALKLARLIHLLFYINTQPEIILDAWERVNFTPNVELLHPFPLVQMEIRCENLSYIITPQFVERGEYKHTINKVEFV